jgi:hypothetical protein
MLSNYSYGIWVSNRADSSNIPPKLSENSDSPLAPKLRFGSALAYETPFHIIFVASVDFTPDANPLRVDLFNSFCIGDGVLPLHILLV